MVDVVRRRFVAKPSSIDTKNSLFAETTIAEKGVVCQDKWNRNIWLNGEARNGLVFYNKHVLFEQQYSLPAFQMHQKLRS